MSRPSSPAHGRTRSWLPVLLIGGALVAGIAVWLDAPDTGGGDLAGAPVPRPRDAMSAPLAPSDEGNGSVPPITLGDARPLAVPAGRIVAVERLEPVRAYDRQVLLAPDANYVSSRVLDADGAPVAGAQVLLYRTYSGTHGERGVIEIDAAITDDEGRFEVGRSESDWFGSRWTREWRLSVRADGHARWHGYPVPVGAPADVLLPRAVPVDLVLKLEDGTPLAGAAVREHFVLVEELRGNEAAPYWAWGETDALGRLAILLAEDHLDPLVRIDHPDHASTRRLPAAGPEGEIVLKLEPHRALDVTWTGDHEARAERGLMLPPVNLEHVHEPEGFLGFGVSKSERFAYATRADGDTVHFEHLSDEPVVLRGSFRGPLLVGEFVPQPGRQRIELPLPVLERFVPGESGWGVLLSISFTGTHISARRTLVLRGADGTVQQVSNWSDNGWPMRTTLLPPVTVFFEEWGPQGPHVEGVNPGDVVELVVDGARYLEWSAALRVDTRLLDEARAANAKLFVKRVGTNAYPRKAGLLAAGLAPGRWEYSVRGDGIQRIDGELDLDVGDEVLLEPQPDAWPDVDPRPHDLREAHALVEGRILVEGDPWAHVGRLLLIPTPSDDTEEGETLQTGVRGGAFRLAVPPGSYRVEVRMERNRYPQLSLEQGFGLEDDHRVDHGAAILDPPVEFHLAEGERRTLELTVQAGPPRGRIVARVLLDGKPAPATDDEWGFNLYYKASWTDAEGQVTVDQLYWLDDESYLHLSVPPGPGTLRLAPNARVEAAFPAGLPEPVEIELDAPTPRDVDGEPQALEVTVELHSPEVPADGAH